MMFYTEKEISTIFRVSSSQAYQIIVTLRKELQEKGFLTTITGGIQSCYVWERYRLTEKDCQRALDGSYLAIYGVEDVERILGVSKFNSQKFIRILRDDFHKLGYLTPKRGSIQADYFCERYLLTENQCKKALKLSKQEAS